jgi:prepilin signal peptidase PulO-like enzyme (type II secretory pathway)
MIATTVLLGTLGVIFGSFVNALVWRMHEQEELVGKKGKAAQERRQALSISRGRSMCTHCGHELAAKDLVPVLSWLSLGGRCRYCHAAISVQYPLVEIVTGALFALSYVWWPLPLHGVGLFQFILWLVFVVGFVALAVYDIRWFLLPDRIVLPLALLAALQVIVVALWTGDWAKLYEPLLALAIIFGLFWGLFQLSKGRWIGGGDVKLAVCLGLLAATPACAFLVIFGASLLGTLASAPLLAHGKQGLRRHIPFGPYLLAATFIVVLWGGSIVHWYQNLILG